MNKRIILIEIAVVVMMVICGLVVAWQRGHIQPRVQASKVETVEYEYHLRNGWTLIGFPMKPITVTSAKELMDFVDRQGGYLTMISRWDGDRWQEYAAIGNSRFGQDFSLVQGEAYFVSNAKDITISLFGVVSGSQAEIALESGWNAVALSATQYADARKILDQAHKEKQETATEIDRWLSGNWQAFVKRWYSSDSIQEYGENFAIESQGGYMIKANQPVRLSP